MSLALMTLPLSSSTLSPFLVEAMRNLGMIETQGGGIRKLYLQQQKRCFPMPDYSFEENYVKVTLINQQRSPKEENYFVSVTKLEDTLNFLHCNLT